MPDISKIQLPGSGGVYNIKDAVAREMISGGVSFIIAWDGNSLPTVSAIPQGIVVRYNGNNYTGTLSANDEAVQPGAFYLVKSNTTTTGSPKDIYDEYVPVGVAGEKIWEKLGDTQIDLTDVVTRVTLSKQTDNVLGADTTFTNGTSSVSFNNDGTTATVLGATTTLTNSSSSVSFTGDATDNVLGENATFTTTVTPTTTYIEASTLDNDFVTSVTAETNKNLVTTSITGTNGTTTASEVSTVTSKLDITSVPNVSSTTSVTVPNITNHASRTSNYSNWEFSMGAGDDAETLIISGGNGPDVTSTQVTFGNSPLEATLVTMGNDITVATGTISANGKGSDVFGGLTITPKTNIALQAASSTTVATGATAVNGHGDAIVTGVTVGSTAKALTSVTLGTKATSGTGRVQVATGITNATTTVNDGDIVAAVTDIGTGTAAAQQITVGTNDRQTVVKTLPTATAAAQTITVGSNDTIAVLTDQTTINVGKGNQ